MSKDYLDRAESIAYQDGFSDGFSGRPSRAMAYTFIASYQQGYRKGQAEKNRENRMIQKLTTPKQVD